MEDAIQDGSASARRPRVLLISADPIGTQMGGLGIRYHELARVLARHAAVTLAHGGTEERPEAGERPGDVRTVPYRPHAPGALKRLIAAADTIVAHPQWPLVDRWLRRSAARVVIDLYCPETLETLELLNGRAPSVRRQLTATTEDRLHASLRTGHHFICASETQRDLWLGAMLALRLIDAETYDRDPSFRDVIDLVPFGVPEHPPRADAHGGPRDAIGGLMPEDEIVLWNGGIWNWLDAETAIRAVAIVAQRRPSVRLLFMATSTGHPASARATRAARELAGSLGLLGSVVHFHEGWVPYSERDAWLTQASCAISSHGEHLEARFAYRTRLLDCFWAGLPVVCTSGDDLAERVAREQLGAVAPPSDVNALSSALERVLKRGRAAYADSLRAAAERQTWPLVAAPLVRWISEPALSRRPGDAHGVVRPPLGQRMREVAYLAGGRAILARR